MLASQICGDTIPHTVIIDIICRTVEVRVMLEAYLTTHTPPYETLWKDVLQF